MSAPLGNQNAKNNKGGGRKGYEYEKKQLKKMNIIFNYALRLTDKVMKGKATDKEISDYEHSIKVVLKIMDKLHANSLKIGGQGESGEIVINIDNTLANKYDLTLKAEDNSEGQPPV